MLGRRFASDSSWLRALAAGALLAPSVEAQIRPELRAEFVTAEQERVEVGGGLTLRIGNYLRTNATTTYDVWSSSDSASAQWRGEAAVRFLLDPLAERSWGLSFGAGAGYRERAYLLALMDLEGPIVAGFRPALSAGLGGGTRVALVLRTRSDRDRR